MESVNSKLVKLSLSILSFVFFGCGNKPDETISSNPEAPVIITPDTDEGPNNTESNLDDEEGVKISNENMKNLLAQMQKQADNNKLLAEKARKVIGASEKLDSLKEDDPGYQDAYDELMEANGELVDFAQDSEIFTVGTLSEEEKNALKEIPRGERKVFEKIEKILEKIELLVYEPLKEPECVIAMGKRKGVGRADRATAIWLGLGVVEKTANKYVSQIEDLAEKFDQAIENNPSIAAIGQGLKDRIDQVRGKVENIEGYKNEVATKVYEKWDADIAEQTGLLNLHTKDIFLSNALVNAPTKVRCAFNSFWVSYIFRGQKTNHKDPMTLYSYFSGVTRKKLESQLDSKIFATTDEAVRSLGLRYCGEVASIVENHFGVDLSELKNSRSVFDKMCSKDGKNVHHLGLREMNACLMNEGDFREACDHLEVKGKKKKKIGMVNIDGDSFQDFVTGEYARTFVDTASLYGYSWNGESHRNMMRIIKKYRAQQKKNAKNNAAEDKE